MNKNYNSTLARVAGNLMSGVSEEWLGDKQGRAQAIYEAVATAREIVAEIERTEPTVMAAAPDMLAALQHTLDYWKSTWFAECEPDCDCVVDLVRAAIAKAEGRSAS